MASVLSAPSVTIPAMDCANCKSQGAKLVCSTCGTFYCNVPCQAKHWPTHRDYCMPRLVMASPLIGTVAYVSQNITPSIPKPSNMMAKPCDDKPKPNMTTNAHIVKPTPGNGNINNRKKSPNNGKKGSSPPRTVTANDVSRENAQLNAKKTQEKIARIFNKANDANAKMTSSEKPLQKAVTPTAEKQKTEMAFSSTPIPKVNTEKCGQKAEGPPMEKKMDEMSLNSTASPKANMEKYVQQQAIRPTQDKPMQKPVAPGANDTITKSFTTQNNVRPAVPKVNDQKPVGTISSQHLQQAAFPEPGSKVLISYVADDRLYIYETGPGPNGEPNSFEMLIARSIECSRGVQSYVSAPPTVGDIVFAAYDGDYFRAVVKSISNATVEVFFPDFGNSQTVQWNTLKEIPDPKVKYANCLTHAVWIQNVPTFTVGMKKFLNTLADVTEFMLYTVIDVQNSSIKMVEMYQPNEQYHLSVKLRNFNLQPMSVVPSKELPVQPKSPQHTAKYVITNPNTYKPVYLEELIDPGTIEGKGIELVIINATENQLSVVTKSSYTLFTTMLKDSDVYGKIDPNPYEPKENEACLVKADGIWYRAITLQPSDGASNIYLLDELQCIGAENVEIRRYPPGLTRQQFVVECVCENTNVLLEAMGGSTTNADLLSGCSMVADVHNSLAEEDAYETTHLTIVSIGQ